MHIIIKTPVYNGFGYHLFCIMNDLLKEIPSLDPGGQSVTKSSDTQLLEKILNQLLITNSHLERIARRLDHQSAAEFEGKVESRSTRGPRVEYGLEEDDFNCIEELAAKTKYSVEQSRPTSIQSERTQFMGVPYANRNELLASLVMSLYHTILDGDPMFRTVSRRPDFISFHSRGTSIVQGVAKALGNEKSAIPEIKDTSMQTLAGFLIREEKGEVFVIRPEVLQMIRDGAKTASLFGICEAVMLALSKVYELFPYPVCCLAAAVREPLVRGEGDDLEYNVDRDLVRKLLSERKDVSLTEYQSVKHANLALYIRLRLRTSLTHESANKMVSTKSPEQVEKFMRTFSSQKSDPHPTKRKSATVKSSLTMV